MFANNNALVSAEDQTTLTLVSGNITGSGTAAVGIGAGISVLNKNTNSYIASDAQVTALASGAAVQANTGRFGQASGNNDPVPAVNVDFTTANVANNTISAASHGLSTGNEVVYSGANLPLGGLDNGGAYFVIKVNDNQFQLAKSFADAQAGIAIALSAGLTSQTDQHTAQRLNPIGVPSVWTDNVPTSQLNLGNLAKNLEGPPQQAARQGVIVVAVSTSHMEGAGAAGGGSGSVAVSVAGGFAVHTINTTASIGSGAQISQTSGGSAQQSVYVDAGRAYHNLTLGIGAAFSGAVAISPAVAVPILQGTTSAKIIGAGSSLVKDDGTTSGGPTLVSAKQDVEVAAVAQADFIAIAVGLTASGTAAIAGSGAVIVVTTTTEASIGGLAQVAASGNVLVSALDVTTAYAIAGGVGIGIGGGGGAGAFAVSVITKNTNAYIRDDAVVDAGGNGSSLLTGIMTGDLNTQQAIRGVAVQAYSSETLVNVAGSGAGGSYVGIAGSVDAEIVNSNTVAAIFGGAQVNQNNSATANALQTVAVGARNDLKVTAVAGAVAISATVGVGAGADIQVIRNNAVAFIADSGTKVRARNAVNVDALSTRDILSIGVAAGVGQFALAGGISVISIGGAFSDQYTGGSEGGSSYSSNALSGGNSGSVIPSIDDAINKALAALDTPDSGGLPAINPATAVNNTNHTVNFGVADNLSTGDAVQYSTGGGAPIAGLQNNQTYFVITQGPNAIQLAATRDDALAGRFIEIASNGATGTTHQFSNGNASIANAARTTATPALPSSPLANGTQPPVVRPIASGTSALVGSGAEIAASTLAVQANQLFNLQSYPGSLGLSAYASLGVGLAVVNIASSVTAYISPAVTITGLGGSGSLSIDATRNATTKVLGIAGSVSGLIALGSAVAYVSDTSSVQATLGVNVTDSGLFQANSASGAATVGGAGFALIEVDAEHTETMNLATGAGSLSLIVGLGAAITVADIEGNTRAIIGDYTIIAPSDKLTVKANRTATIGPYDVNGPMGVGIAGSLLGGSASYVSATTGGAVAAYIGAAADINVSGDISVAATAATTHNVWGNGGFLGAIAVGVIISNSTVTGAVTAAIGRSPSSATGATSVKGKSITISATGTPTATVKSTPTGGGVLAGSGAVATVKMSPTVSAEVADQTTLESTNGDISITSTSSPTASAEATGVILGAVAVGVSTANVTFQNTNTASIGAGANISAFQNFSALATTTNTPTAKAEGSASALIPVSVSESNVTLTGDTNNITAATIGTGAQIRAYGGLAAPLGTLNIEARASTTARSTANTDTQGVGAGANSTANLTINGASNTTVGQDAVLEAKTVSILARVVKVDAKAVSNARVNIAVAAGSTANANMITNSGASVILMSGATITGSDTVNIKARQETLDTFSQATAKTIALGPATANVLNTLNTTTTVNAISPTTTVAARTLNVEAYANPNPNFSVDPTETGIPGGGSKSQTLGLVRAINWNAAIVMLGAPDAVLEFDAAGNVIAQQNITFTKDVANNVIRVGDLFNSGTLAGTVNFSIASSFYDTSPSGYGTINASATINGAPVITFNTGFNQVTIANASTFNLLINAINVINNATSFNGHVNVNVGNKSGFSWTTPTNPGATKIKIQNTATAAPTNITFNGAINNPFGTITATTESGNLVSGGPLAVIKTNNLVLGAANGAIGAAGQPILTQAGGLVAAQAKGDIYLNGTGDLHLGYVGAIVNAATVDGVRSDTGVVNIQATGAIAGAGGNTGGTANILARTIVLAALGGGIGSAAAPLNVGSTVAETVLSASATGDIVVTDVVAGDQLTVANVQSSNGDIVLTTKASALSGDDIVLEAASVVSAANGAVALQAADDLTTAAGSQILAAHQAALRGDFDNTIDPSGKTITLKGVVKAASALITSGPHQDAINLANVNANTPTTISAGGNSTITIGLINAASGGLLNQIAGQLTIDAADANNVTGTLATAGSNAVLSGLGMGGSIQYRNLQTTEIALGSGSNLFNVMATLAGTTTTVTLGAGASTVRVGGPNGTATDTVRGIQGLLNLVGNDTSATLNLVDTGETQATSATIGTSRITGLGMGADPATAGIQYNRFTALNVSLGSGADTVAVTGIATPTLLNTGTGGDSVRVGQATGSIGLTLITSQLTVQGSGSANDQLTIQSNISSALTLDETSPTIGLVTGVGSTTDPGQIAFSGMATLVVAQSDTDASSLTINNTVTRTIANSGGGGHQIAVNRAANEITLNLGADDDAVVRDAGAAVSVIGGATNTLTLDLSATTQALNAKILDGPTPGSSALLRGFLLSGGDVNVSNVGKVTVDEGTGNDTIEINTTDASSILTLNAASGDNSYTVKAIGAVTNIVGGDGTDTVTLVIPGLPTANQFANLNATVANLFVDNSAYTAAVAWTNSDGSIFAAPASGGSAVLVVNASSAALTKIVGATGQNNTLNVTATSSGSVTGTITDHKVVLASGLSVLAEPENSTYLNYSNAMSFDGLASGSTAYSEGGFTLATSNGAGFVLDDVISPSAEERAVGDVFTLTATDSSPFTLYSLQFLNTGTTPQQIVLKADTISGGHIELEPITISGSGFQTVTLKQSDGFSGLTKVYWTTGATAVDNVVSIKTPGATAAQPTPAVPQITISSTAQNPLIFNTTTGMISGGTLSGGSPTVNTSTAGITQFVFTGELTITAGSVVKAVGSRGLSILVTGNVNIQANVTFDASSTYNTQSQTWTVGAGGGAGGGGGGGGRGGGYGTAPQGGVSGDPDGGTRAGTYYTSIGLVGGNGKGGSSYTRGGDGYLGGFSWNGSSWVPLGPSGSGAAARAAAAAAAAARSRGRETAAPAAWAATGGPGQAGSMAELASPASTTSAP